MQRLLVLIAGLSFIHLAHAQDKAKAEFTPSAEYRARYFYMQNPGAQKGAAANESFAEHRFKVGLSYKANERFSARMTLLHAADFGSSSGEVGTTNSNEANATFDPGNQENFLNVNEAYLNWMFSDDMTFRIGRQNFQIGDGSVIGINDWEQNPFAFDGLTANWEADFGRFQVLVFNYREEAAGTSASHDQKHTAYGLNFDLKTMPEWVRMLNAHVIKDNADLITGGTGSNVNAASGQDIVRYGLNVSLAYGLLDLRGWYEAQAGKYKEDGSALTPAVDVRELTAKGSMYQGELGVKFEGLMSSRFFVNYHVDSGDKDAADGDAGTYDPYFYERHDNAGLMDLFSWGNLTSTTLGWTFKPVDSTDVGLSYLMLSRTEKGSAPTMGRFGQFATVTASDSTDLGNEIDLWTEHRYDGGLSTILRAGYFMPGGYYDNSTDKISDPILHLSIEGKISF